MGTVGTCSSPVLCLLCFLHSFNTPISSSQRNPQALPAALAIFCACLCDCSYHITVTRFFSGWLVPLRSPWKGPGLGKPSSQELCVQEG